MSGSSSPFSKVLIAAICIAIGIGFLLFLRNTDRDMPPERDLHHDQKLTEAELLSLLKAKNRGIALLENEQFAESAGEFEEVIRIASKEPLGHQDLCVAILMQLDAQAAQLPPAQLTRLTKRVGQAIEQLRLCLPDSAIPYLFSARLAGFQKKYEEAVKQLEQATEHDQHDPSLWYALYEACRQNGHDDLKKELNALVHAQQLEPENLFLLTELLLIQAETEQVEIRKTLQQTRTVIRPFLASIKKMTRLDAGELIEKTISQLDGKPEAAAWKQVKRNVRILINVLKPEDLMQSDRRRIAKNMLEYVRFRFSPALQKQGKEIKPTAQQSLPISFAKRTETETFNEASPFLSFRLGDFDLDGQTDIVTLGANELSVWSKKETDESWQKIAQMELHYPVHSFVLVDLDQDIEENQNRPGLRNDPNPSEKKNPTDENTDPRLQIGPEFDADLDIVLISEDGIRLIENRHEPETGKRTLVEVRRDQEVDGKVEADRNVEAERKVETDGKAPSINVSSARQVLPVDFDHDGDLDFCVATQHEISLWRRVSAFRYENISGGSALPGNDLVIHSLVAVDWDRDVDLDIVVGTQDGKRLGFLENLRHGRFQWREFPILELTPGKLSDLQVIDADANASWDLLLAGTSGIHVVKTELSPGGNVNLLPASRISGDPCDEIHLADFDNNGWLDIVSLQTDSVQLFLADSRGIFDKKTAVTPFESVSARQVASSDFDCDGDLDLCVLGSGDSSGKEKKHSLFLLTNQGGEKNNWLEIALRAEQIKGNQRSASGRVNHYGIGSLLELKAGQLYQPRTVNSQVTHFGLGQHNSAEVLRILWTNGIPANILSPARNSRIYEKQTLKGSCPYLYAWNGERYEFVTDLLWASPLGLVTPTGELAPYREWEYLLVKGEQLRPKEGTYDLQITEELWEAAYFDTVQLIAIDHPADVQIFSNEKVGPAHLASFGIHTVRTPRKPVSVTNQYHDDLLDLVSERDGRYAKPFRKKQRQGVVEKHYLEINFGKLKNPKSIKLFLTGWIRPSDTSINTAMAQDGTVAPPTPLSLSVMNSLGKWEQVMPFTGFPGGKTKTIVIDLSNSFLTDNYRLRLIGEQELYWDHIFYTVDETPVDFSRIDCKLVEADLHDRGFSQVIPPPRYGPELYAYDVVSKFSKWPPMQGYLTNYGDVRKLIDKKDERLVVMGAGDELTLRFEVPDQPVPENWQRDFILYNVGWDKDADLNTVYGQSVDPLPFYRMSRYPYITDGDITHVESLQRDVSAGRRRLQSRSRFWNALKKSTLPVENRQDQ